MGNAISTIIVGADRSRRHRRRALRPLQGQVVSARTAGRRPCDRGHRSSPASAPSRPPARLPGTPTSSGPTRRTAPAFEQVPTRVRLEFSDDMDPALSTVTLREGDGAGTSLELASGRTRDRAGGNGAGLADAGGRDAPGGRSTFRVVSRDGHPVVGTLEFVVRASPRTGLGEPARTTAPRCSPNPARATEPGPSDGGSRWTRSRRTTTRPGPSSPSAWEPCSCCSSWRVARSCGWSVGTGTREPLASTGARSACLAPAGGRGCPDGLVALVATGLTGGLSPLGIDGLPDPGTLTRVGLPTVQVIRDLAAMVTVGALVLAATCVPPPAGSREAAPWVRRGGGWWRGHSCRPPCGQWPASPWSRFVYSDASGSAIGRSGVRQ